MADRDRFGGSDRDYLPEGKATSQVNHQGYSPPWRDTRFGGNMERANTGIPYPTGGRDVRFEGSLPHKFSYLDNGRSVTSDVEPYWTDMGRNWSVPIPQSRTGTPNFRPPYGAPGQPSYNEWLQQIDPYNPFHTGTYPPKKHPNPRMRGMGGRGLGSFDEAKINLQDVQDRIGGDINWNKFFRDLDARGIEYAENDTGIGSLDEYLMAELSTPQLDFMGGSYGNPGGGGYSQGASGWDAYKSNVNKYEDKGSWFPWRGAQEPATDKEIMDQLKRNIRNKKWGRDTPSQVSPNWRVTT